MVRVTAGKKSEDESSIYLAITQEHLDSDEFTIIDGRPFLEGFEVTRKPSPLNLENPVSRFLIIYPLKRRVEAYSPLAEETGLCLAKLFEQRSQGEFVLNRLY